MGQFECSKGGRMAVQKEMAGYQALSSRLKGEPIIGKAVKS